MSEFRKYDHVERCGHPHVEGIDIGTVHVFAKLDGTNASVWAQPATGRATGSIIFRAAARTRELSLENDNAGFYAWVLGCEGCGPLGDVFRTYPDWILYGEWLVPHTLKTYREDAWRRFWIFDVWDRDQERYLPVEDYLDPLRDAGLDVIEPLCTFNNPSEEQLRREVETNSYLILDGAGVGEGIVLKNYGWVNKYGLQPWAKIVRNEFKEENRRAFGVTEKNGEFQVEAAIAEQFVTAALVAKERSKIVMDLMNRHGAPGFDTDVDAFQYLEAVHRGELIPRLLQTVYHSIVAEELWAAVKKYKNPVIDFRKLSHHVTHWTKKHARDLF